MIKMAPRPAVADTTSRDRICRQAGRKRSSRATAAAMMMLQMVSGSNAELRTRPRGSLRESGTTSTTETGAAGAR